MTGWKASAFFPASLLQRKGWPMNLNTDTPSIRTYAASRPRREASDYVYQAATVAAAILVLLTAAI
jgi:hypothetical protein